MRKVDFRHIRVEDIEGNPVDTDLSKPLGNAIYNQCHDIGEAELARRIYLHGEAELDAAATETIRRHTAQWPYILRTAIEAALACTER